MRFSRHLEMISERISAAGVVGPVVLRDTFYGRVIDGSFGFIVPENASADQLRTAVSAAYSVYDELGRTSVATATGVELGSYAGGTDDRSWIDPALPLSSQPEALRTPPTISLDYINAALDNANRSTA
jgi:hypothetical protein